MIFHEHSVQRTVLIWVASFGLLTQSPVGAQEESSIQAEIKAVFRISKQYLDDVTDRNIVADIPLCATVIGFRCTGEIHGEATATVTLQSSGETAVFSVNSRGNGDACITGVRGPIVAVGPAWGPFTSRTLVQFDGREFTHLETTPSVRLHAEVQRVTGRRDRRLGRMMGAGIQPCAQRMLPRALVQAKPIAVRYLHDFIRETADNIIAMLNAKTPVEASVNRLFPKTRDWVFHMSSNATHLQAAYGPAAVEVPQLPPVPVDGIQNARLEVWLKSTGAEAKLLADMSKNPLANQLVQRYLESTLPELAALAEERSVDAVDDWVVIRIGA